MEVWIARETYLDLNLVLYLLQQPLFDITLGKIIRILRAIQLISLEDEPVDRCDSSS